MKTLFGITLVAISLLIGVPQIRAECDNSILPYSGICGQGQCVNGTCVCFEGFSGHAEFWDTTGRNCVTHDLTRLVLLYICYALSILGQFIILYRFYVLWNPSARAAAGYKISAVMMIAATLVGEFIGVFAMLSFLIHGNQYMHSSIGGNIGLMVGSSFGYACSAFISIFQLQMAIRSIQLRDNERSLIKRIYNATIAANVIAELLLGASLIGNLVATDWIVELGWMRAQMVATLFSSLLLGILQYKYFTDLVTLLQDHIESGNQLGNQSDQSPILKAINRLRRLRITSASSFGPAAILPIICIVCPAISTYYLPVGYSVLICTGLSAAMTLKPPSNRQNASQMTSSGTHTSTVTHG